MRLRIVFFLALLSTAAVGNDAVRCKLRLTRPRGAFLPASQRERIYDNPHLRNRAPRDLTESALTNPNALHYLWFPDELAIPAIEAVVPTAVHIGDGSAVVVSNRGHLLTNAHVARPLRFTGNLTVNRARYSLAGGRVIAINDEGEPDLALLLVPSIAGRMVVPRLARREPEDDTPIISIGFPAWIRSELEAGDEPAISFGNVIGHGEWAIASDTETQGGSSGSPLFNPEGQLVGLTCWSREAGFTVRSQGVRLSAIRAFLAAHGLHQ